MQQWTLLYSTRSLPEATILKGRLEENQVPVLLMNKQDSSYLNFGDVELYVPVTLRGIAANLLGNGLSN